MSPSTGLGELNSHIVTVCLLVYSLGLFKKTVIVLIVSKSLLN